MAVISGNVRMLVTMNVLSSNPGKMCSSPATAELQSGEDRSTIMELTHVATQDITDHLYLVCILFPVCPHASDLYLR